MSENILVVEYEPRYTDRVRQALAGQPFTPTFAKDGEEAIKVLDGNSPRLIVLSSVVPKISTTELIRAIRGRKPLQETPILLTVSGYNGKSPKADAQRVGASDILPKPYSETEFLGKVQQMLGIRADTPLLDDFRPSTGAGLTSTEIFGDLLEDDKPSTGSVKKPAASRATGDVDKMLADTLAGVMPQRKEKPTQTGSVPVPPVPTPAPAPAPAPQQPPVQTKSGEQRARPSQGELDKMLSDTLSGLEKTTRARTTGSGTTPRPATPTPPPSSIPTPQPTPAPASPQPDKKRFDTARMQAFTGEKMPMAQPVVAPPVQTRAEEDEVTDGVKFGQYVLVEKIATGGMAEVWKARMRGVEGFQKIVAIKKILPHLSDNQDFIEMFIDEAKLAAQLNHNNIIHIYDLGKIQSSYYIAMEYIDGYDLKTILRRGEERAQPMGVELALFVASKIASALDYAHRKKDFEEREMGLVHRDVSPQNVLISQEGDIKLCDFGIAKAASKASHTQAGALKGKLQYMSPEQAWGRNIDRRSDVFALATVLFEMLTGRKLFTGDNELSILEQVREARVQAPSEFNDEVTPDIDKVVLKALQKDPANRYQTAGDMARDLDAILYSYKPTPTSADLAIFMHRISTEEPVAHQQQTETFTAPAPAPAPAPIPAPVAATAAAAAPIAAAPVAAAAVVEPWEQPAAKKKSPVPMIAVAVGLLVVIGGAAFVFLGGKKDGAANATQTTAAPNTTAASATAATGTIVPATTAATATTATTGTTTAIDLSLVDQEVAKRIAAERARLQALAQQQQQQTTTAAPARPTPAPVQTAAAPVVPAPQPQQQETRPAPAQPQPQETRPAPAQPQPQEETRPAPAQPQPQQQAARPSFREGDLVPQGTPGLVLPRMTSRASVAYPPVARMQRVEGIIITNVLVGENGQVLEVRIIRGSNRPVGLNEAAEQAMRRSKFAPGTVDGVRVKSWLTVPVEFKL